MNVKMQRYKLALKISGVGLLISIVAAFVLQLVVGQMDNKPVGLILLFISVFSVGFIALIAAAVSGRLDHLINR